jgi:hypothetical protein
MYYPFQNNRSLPLSINHIPITISLIHASSKTPSIPPFLARRRIQTAAADGGKVSTFVGRPCMGLAQFCSSLPTLTHPASPIAAACMPRLVVFLVWNRMFRNLSSSSFFASAVSGREGNGRRTRRVCWRRRLTGIYTAQSQTPPTMAEEGGAEGDLSLAWRRIIISSSSSPH